MISTDLIVSRGAGWRLYSNTIPVGSQAIGTVRRANGDAGALVITPAGVYAQLNAGVLRLLPDAPVRAALGR